MPKEKKKKQKSVLGFIRALFLSYLMTACIVVVLGFILYKQGLSHQMMLIGSIAAYVLSCFMGGIVMGKSGRARAFLWGMALGGTYYAVLLLISVLIPNQTSVDQWSILINLGICVLSGMTGAMVAKK